MDVYTQCLNNLSLSVPPEILVECFTKYPETENLLLEFKDFKNTTFPKKISVNSVLQFKNILERIKLLKQALKNNFSLIKVNYFMSFDVDGTQELINELLELNKTINIISNKSLLNDMLNILKLRDADVVSLSEEEVSSNYKLNLTKLFVKYNLCESLDELKHFSRYTVDLLAVKHCMNTQIIPDRLCSNYIKTVVLMKLESSNTYLTKLAFIRNTLGNISLESIAFELTYAELKFCLDLNCNEQLKLPLSKYSEFRVVDYIPRFIKVLAFKLIPEALLVERNFDALAEFIQTNILRMPNGISDIKPTLEFLKLPSNLYVYDFKDLAYNYVLINKLESLNVYDTDLTNYFIQNLNKVTDGATDIDTLMTVFKFVDSLNLDSLKKYNYLKNLGKELKLQMNKNYIRINKNLLKTVATLLVLSECIE